MSFIKTRKKIVSSAIASSLSVIATAAIAQEQVEVLKTINVHAEANQAESLKIDQSANAKFVAPLKDTPKSVSILSQKLLQETNSNTLLEALRNEPGITLGAGEGGVPYTDIPYIRGYNGQSSIYVDGVRNTTSQNRDMFAIEQVEVIKGSSSALGGGGSIGTVKVRDFDSEVSLGLNGVLGLDYKFKGAPINLSLDWIPTLRLTPDTDFYSGDIGLGVRFTF